MQRWGFFFLTQQLPQLRPHVVQHGRMRFCARVDTVGLEHRRGVRSIGHPLQKEGHHRCLACLRHFGKQVAKPFGVVATIVGWHLHTHQQHLGPGFLGGFGHKTQVVFGVGQGQAAQRIVATEFNHHMGGLVLLQQGGQAAAATRCGFTTHTRIHHSRRDLFLRKPFFEQRHPAFATFEPIFGAQRVTQHQNGGSRLGQNSTRAQAPG